MTAFDPDKDMISQISHHLYKNIATYDNIFELLSKNKIIFL